MIKWLLRNKAKIEKPQKYDWEIPKDFSWVSSGKHFDNMRVDKTVLRAWGFVYFERPKKHDVIKAEFQTSYLYFEIINIDRPWNPGYQVFLDLKLKYIEMKND